MGECLYTPGAVLLLADRNVARHMSFLGGKAPSELCIYLSNGFAEMNFSALDFRVSKRLGESERQKVVCD